MIFGFACIIPQEIFGENFNLIITGEQNPRIDSDYIYVVSVNGTLGEERLLHIYLNDGTEQFPLGEFKFSKYAPELVYRLTLDMSKFEWNVENKYDIIAKIDTVTSNFTLQPKSFEVQHTSTSFNDPTVRIYGFIKKDMPDRWLSIIDICAGTKRLTTPTVRITSDLDDTETQLNKIVAPNSCSSMQDYDVVARDPDSIRIQYVGLDLKYDTKENIVEPKPTPSTETPVTTDEKEIQQTTTTKIPEWVKSTMQWYLDGSISEDEMIKAIQFLVKEKIIKLD